MSAIGDFSRTSRAMATGDVPVSINNEVSYQYALPVCMDSQRRTVRVQPIQGGTYNPESTIIFRFQGDFIDFANSYLSFTAGITITGTAGNDAFTLNSIHDLIRSIEITELATGKTLENIQDYNCLRALLSDCSVNGASNYYEGAVTVPTQADTVEATLTQNYSIQLLSGLLQNDYFIPAKYMGGGLELRITLESAVNALYGTGTDKTFALSDVSYITDIVAMDPAFANGLQSFLLSDPANHIAIPYDNFTTHVGLKTSTGYTINISEQMSELLDVYAVQRLATDFGAAGNNSVSLFNSNGYASHQFITASGHAFPNFMVNRQDIAYVELRKALNKLGDVQMVNSLTRATYEGNNVNHFIIGQSFERTQRTDCIKKGISTFKEGQLTLTINGHTANARVNAFTHSKRLLYVLGDGSCVVEL